MYSYLRDGFGWMKNPYKVLDEKMQKHGMSFRINLPVLGNVFMTGDPIFISQIIRHPDTGKGKGVEALSAILGKKSLIMKQDLEHLQRRRLLAPFFRWKTTEKYAQFIKEKTKETFQNIPLGKEFSIFKKTQCILLSAILFAIFGEMSEEEEKRMENLVLNFLGSFKNPMILFLRPLRVDLGKYSPWGRAIRNRNFLYSAIGKFIQQQKEDGQRDNILSNILKSGGEIEEEELAEEILALLLFALDSGAATLSWTFALLYQNPEIVSKIKNDLHGQSGKSEENPYLIACLEESMRMYPVVVHLTRIAKNDMQIGDWKIQKGETMIPCTYMAQNNPEIFSNPREFFPERFMMNKKYEFSFFPFGLGNRICIGKNLALREMLSILDTVITEFDLELMKGYHPVPARKLVLMIPEKGTLMKKSV